MITAVVWQQQQHQQHIVERFSRTVAHRHRPRPRSNAITSYYASNWESDISCRLGDNRVVVSWLLFIFKKIVWGASQTSMRGCQPLFRVLYIQSEVWQPLFGVLYIQKYIHMKNFRMYNVPNFSRYLHSSKALPHGPARSALVRFVLRMTHCLKQCTFIFHIWYMM